MKHLLNILTVWRISEMLYDEEGPYDSLKRFRDYVKLNKATGGGKNAKQSGYGRLLHEIDEALDCMWCRTVWIGFFVAKATGQPLLYGFAYSAGALLFKPLFTVANRIGEK